MKIIIICAYISIVLISILLAWTHIGWKTINYFKSKYPEMKSFIPKRPWIKDAPDRLDVAKNPGIVIKSLKEKESNFFYSTIFLPKFDSDPQVKILKKQLIGFWIYCFIFSLVIPVMYVIIDHFIS